MAATTTNADTSPASSGSVDTLLLSSSPMLSSDGVSMCALAWMGLLLFVVVCAFWVAVDDRSALDSGLLECVVLLDAVVMVWMVALRLVGDLWVVNGRSIVGVVVLAAV